MKPSRRGKYRQPIESIHFEDEQPKKRAPWQELSKALEQISPIQKGGQGSGNFGHAGRPGQVGGSGPQVSAETLLESERVRGVTKEIMDRAKKVEPEITQTMKEISRDQGSELAGLDFRLKTNSGRVSEKIAEKMLENGISAEEAKESIYDTVRYTYVLPEDEYAEGSARIISAMKERGFSVYDHKDKNYWPTPEEGPGIYHGANYVFQDNATGHKFEVQFHTKDSLEAKEAIHKTYEEFRQLNTTRERRKELWLSMNSRWKAVKIPKNAHGFGTRVFQRSSDPVLLCGGL